MAEIPQRETAGRAPKPNGPKRAASDLPARAGAGVALMALALGAVWAGFYWFMAFWFIAAALVNWEWQSLVGGADLRLRVALASVALAAGAVLSIDGEAHFAILVLGCGAVLAAFGGGWRSPWPAGGVLYAGAMLVALCLLRVSEPFGARTILWLFALVWGTDIMAYFGGRTIGGPKLWPRISPGKTWSGFAVGIFCGAAAGLLLAPAGSSKPALFLLGLIGGAVAQGGDLLESAIKRRFGAKDSSHLIPGHGGLMDRLDGFIAAAVFAAIVGVARAGLDHASVGVLQW